MSENEHISTQGLLKYRFKKILFKVLSKKFQWIFIKGLLAHEKVFSFMKCVNFSSLMKSPNYVVKHLPSTQKKS